jgi:glyoxylase-like metal-dependent hydrolase (beta-lactamase superfamily II)
MGMQIQKSTHNLLKRMTFKISILAFFAFLNAKSQTNSTYEIFALKFAERTNKTAVSDIAVGSSSTDSVNVCFMYWLLKGNNGKIILVDAGFTDDMKINSKFITWSAPEKKLSELKIKPEEVTDIILTHPHWDHIGGISLYPNAHIWMQSNDYNYFVNDAWQKGGNNSGFNKTDVIKVVEKNLENKLTLLKGDSVEILPGIKVFIGSKHTFESQFVLVNSKSEKVIIASDCAWYYYNLSSLLPIPVTHDANAYTENMKRMKSMVDKQDMIIPGHDPLVFSKFETVGNGIVKITSP